MLFSKGGIDMKRLTALLLCILLLTLAACGEADGQAPKNSGDPDGKTPSVTDPSAPDASPDDGSLKWSDYVFKGNYTDENLTSAALVTLNITLPKVEGNEDITLYYDNVIDRLKESAQTYYLDIARGNYDLAQDGIGIFTPVVIETSYQVVRNDGVLFSVVRESYENTGGAHPMGAKLGDVFRVADGAKLLFEDVFTVTYDEAVAKLTPIIHKQMDDFTAANGLDNAYYENAKQELFSMWETDDFYLTDESLVLIWQAYSIAPYAAGIQEFSIPLADIADIVDAQWITK